MMLSVLHGFLMSDNVARQTRLSLLLHSISVRHTFQKDLHVNVSAVHTHNCAILGESIFNEDGKTEGSPRVQIYEIEGLPLH